MAQPTATLLPQQQPIQSTPRAAATATAPSVGGSHGILGSGGRGAHDGRKLGTTADSYEVSNLPLEQRVAHYAKEAAAAGAEGNAMRAAMAVHLLNGWVPPGGCGALKPRSLLYKDCWAILFVIYPLLPAQSPPSLRPLSAASCFMVAPSFEHSNALAVAAVAAAPGLVATLVEGVTEGGPESLVAFNALSYMVLAPEVGVGGQVVGFGLPYQVVVPHALSLASTRSPSPIDPPFV